MSFTDSAAPAGITPAYAGSTFRSFLGFEICGDHPRVCGEHRAIFWHKKILMGSPPRMRGALPLGIECLKQLGITPAYAGSTIRYKDFTERR